MTVNTIEKRLGPPIVPMTFDDYEDEYLEDLFMLGNIPFTAYSGDNRFSYCLHIPPSYSELSSLRLVVLIHSSYRDAAELRNAFAPFAREHNCVILAPLFPQGIIDPNDQDNYKRLRYRGIRFDLILLGMIEEIGRRWPKINTAKFFMQGFSGGGQFVHRFAYLYPERLQAVVICAPGSITALDSCTEYPEGTRNIEQLFGIKPNVAALRCVRTALVVGDQDTSVRHLIARSKEPAKCQNRCQTIKALYESWNTSGIPTELYYIPGAGHEPEAMYQITQQYFASELRRLACPVDGTDN